MRFGEEGKYIGQNLKNIFRLDGWMDMERWKLRLSLSLFFFFFFFRGIIF